MTAQRARLPYCPLHWSRRWAQSTVVLGLVLVAACCNRTHHGSDTSNANNTGNPNNTSNVNNNSRAEGAGTEVVLQPTPSALPAAAVAQPAAESAACPSDMQLVDGAYCPEVDQTCLQTHPDDKRLEPSNRRCLRYAEPSVCRSTTRELLRYCVDRFEWPNRAGEKPQVLMRWTDAKTLCAGAGKRLCTDKEWTFACEGEQSRPYTYGFDRDPTRCVLDRLYVTPGQRLTYWTACQRSPGCLAEFARLDQREPAGSFARCVSPFGAFDMNGNANEWVSVEGAAYPHRGGLKGGWWGPVRDRCRPTVRFHREDDWGYEIGFRCCRDAEP